MTVAAVFSRVGEVVAELKSISAALVGISATLEKGIVETQTSNRLLRENQRLLREIRDGLPKYGRRIEDGDPLTDPAMAVVRRGP